MNILVLNAGSSSLKYDLWETSRQAIADRTDRLVFRGAIERVAAIDDALPQVFEKLGDTKVEAVGHRVVHGGDLYYTSVLIDEEVEKGIEELSSLAPLHNPRNLEGIRAARKHLPGIPQVAVFDTAFHHTLPPHAYAYALPYEFLTEKRIRRYGFHGISHRYVAWEFGQMHATTTMPYRLITCHLGNGCSICAIDHGSSVDTSMGFTPLEGLMMGARSGDVDAGAILHLITQEKMDPKDVLNILNSQSGLKGLSGISNDMRDVLKKATLGDLRARLAVETFCYRIRKYIGSYLAAMNGADAIIFTGGIGENSPEIRSRVIDGLSSLGISLDAEANAEKSTTARRIGPRRGSPDIPVWVVPTQEELLIARDTLRCIVPVA